MTEFEVDQRLTDDFLYFVESAPLMVKPKEGPLVPFRLNNAQEILHSEIEKQLKETGKVRALVLKGRQQGVSTYTEARFYWKTSRRPANSTFIITHLADATENLFSMTQRYHENTDERLRTPTKSSSKNGMTFEGLDSNYKIATAGSAEIGRSYTIKNFHGSEFAFWPNAENIFAGALQAVPNLPNTEIILESTANGMTNDFYYMCKKAQEGRGDFRLIFIPWFVQEEYRLPLPDDFVITKEELGLKKRYGLDDNQIYWRRRKIEDEFKGKSTKFMQEYPCNPSEAFQANDDTLIDIEAVSQARQRSVEDFDSPLIMGIDPATRKDRAVFAFRQGRNFKSATIFDCDDEPMTPMELVQQIILSIEENKPDKVFCDNGEIGSAIIDRLRELGYGKLVTGIDFGMAASKPKVYENKRAEMWIQMSDFIHNEKCRLPDSDEVQADLLAMPDYFLNTRQRQQLLSKQKIKIDYKMSTDIGDAFALTFAFPVKKIAGTIKRVGQIKHKSQKERTKVKRKTVKF